MTASENLDCKDLERLSAFAHELADLSEPSILSRFRRLGSVDNKAEAGAYDPVTEADRDVEKAIRAAIAKAYPDHRIIGEEFGVGGGSGEISWVLDPIDGTKAFVTGSPLWGTLIGMTVSGRPVLGLMNQPFTQERYWSDGQQAKYRRSSGEELELQTRRCANLSDAVLSTTSIDLLQPGFEQERFEALSTHIRMRRFGGDCYAYCLLAAGHIDLVVETGLNPYDIVAMIPIIEHAGGAISQWNEGDAAAGGRIVAAGDADIHRAALEILAGAL